MLTGRTLPTPALERLKCLKKTNCCYVVKLALNIVNLFIESTLLKSLEQAFNRASTFWRRFREQIVQSSVSCDVILNPKVGKFLQVDKSGDCFRLNKNLFFSVNKCNF